MSTVPKAKTTRKSTPQPVLNVPLAENDLAVVVALRLVSASGTLDTVNVSVVIPKALDEAFAPGATDQMAMIIEQLLAKPAMVAFTECLKRPPKQEPTVEPNEAEEVTEAECSTTVPVSGAGFVESITPIIPVGSEPTASA